MSFSGTPLGQGRRLDHQTFLSKPPSHPHPSSASQNPLSSTNNVPLSYAYGAPTIPTRSPGKSSTSNRQSSSRVSTDTQPTDDRQEEQEEDDRALARYARLKQRNQVLANRPGSSLGPGIITSPPKPDGASARDTSVNIAGAFHQAANSFSSMATGVRVNYPRSTSVEYERESQSSSHRRLGVPPSRSNSLKPPSKSRPRHNDTDQENSTESIDANGRAKSPFDHIADLTRRALSPATFLMRQRSVEPEGVHPPTRHATDTTLINDDYAEEEAEYQKLVNSNANTVKRPPTTAHRRNRMSVDNRAYKPTASDLESESDVGDDSGRRRKRRSKKDATTGPLNTLPVTSYDKKRRRKSKGSKAANGGDNSAEVNAEDDSVSGESWNDQARSPTPNQQRAPSISRNSVQPPDQSSSFERSIPTDTSMEIMEEGLDPISEVDEDLEPMSDFDSTYEDAHRSLSNTSWSRQPRLSIGALLGSMVNRTYRIGQGAIVLVFRLFALIMLLVGRILNTVLDIFIRHPLRILGQARGDILTQLGKYAILALGMYVAWFALRHPTLMRFSSSRPSFEFKATDAPTGSVEELSSRLLQIENALADIQSEAHSSYSRLERDLRKQRESVGHVGKLEDKIYGEIARSQKSEEDFRSAASSTIEALQREMRTLHEHYARASTPSSASETSDEEARMRLRTLEEKMGGVESSVKEALESSRTAMKGSVGTVPTWWNKILAGSGTLSGLTIKSGDDGQDVTSLIHHLVETAVSRQAKDDLARVDYALHSGGAQVIPSFTSPTYEIKPTTKRGYLYSLITGNGMQIGRPPVTALHHELHVGHCWPFAGSQGHLGIALAVPVYISDITIDHVAKEVAHDLRSAPKDMEVWGMVEGADNLARYDEWRARIEQARNEAIEKGLEPPEEPPYPTNLPPNPPFMKIATLKYDVRSPFHIQTFPVSQEVQELGIDFGLVVLLVRSNWGSEFTCLYRMRVHGTRLHEVPPLPLDDS